MLKLRFLCLIFWCWRREMRIAQHNYLYKSLLLFSFQRVASLRSTNGYCPKSIKCGSNVDLSVKCYLFNFLSLSQAQELELYLILRIPGWTQISFLHPPRKPNFQNPLIFLNKQFIYQSGITTFCKTVARYM